MREPTRSYGQFRRTRALSCVRSARVLWPILLASSGCSALKLDGIERNDASRNRQYSSATDATPASAASGLRPESAIAATSGSRASTPAPVALPESEAAQPGSARGATLLPVSLWRAGTGLVAGPTIGPDGAFYVVSRQAVLDVIEPSGVHRFTITLGAAPSGEIYVDERGWAFIGLVVGKVIGITAEGQKFFSFQAPAGVRGGIAFAEGQGLLFSGSDGIVIGLNRGGFPTMRMTPHARLTAGPVGIAGWCVVATSQGELVWGNRWGKRRSLALGADVQALLPTAAAGMWAIANNEFVAVAADRSIAFRRPKAHALATASRRLRDRGIEGVVLSEDGHLEWLDPAGATVKAMDIESLGPSVRAAQIQSLRLDDEGGVWGNTLEGRVLVWDPGEVREVGALPGSTVFPPVVDAGRRRVLIAAASGEVYGVDWPNSVRAWQ